ncbi:ATP-binding protein [Candidatus Bipolaricaulota bacterium]|nr:ATP-binding protein [Candidatus Bipolaricaulota bacterium]
MKELIVISGKGGTGKTTLVSSLAALAEDFVLADCDVDAPDLHLILDPENYQSEPFYTQVAVKDEEKCSGCGQCLDHCRFGAIDKDYSIDPLACEGCGVCEFVCPEGAIRMEEEVSGHSYLSKTRYGSMAHAELGPGGEASGQLVTRVKENARDLSAEENKELILVDGSPGIGCPVIASLSNADLALIVTEPTQSGIHDLERIAGVAQHFGVRPLVCINKSDLSELNAEEIENFASRKGIQMVGRIPYDREIVEAMVNGKSIVEYTRGETVDAIKGVWEKVRANLWNVED